ncbi:hypothetical protein Acr_25g0008050 [Actinidia rufa]|uniref:RNase H type-1 domain-containing protein n=1 Tax=Actinidia rufa TaxID=165716 RepID=A0A7J0H022_9ERIC|nr:hypothetical protein Acr_25g0008050 [Actinidia rufa]
MGVIWSLAVVVIWWEDRDSNRIDGGGGRPGALDKVQKRVRAGVIARDDKGTVIAVRLKRFGDVESSRVAEALAIREGVQAAAGWGPIL